MNNLNIKDINALEILDSRGNPTIQVKVELENGKTGIASVPSGASTGTFEAVELRDEDKKRFFGKGVLRAVDNVNSIIKSELIGLKADNQFEIDSKLIKTDGTKNKKNLGANATLGISLACARAAANSYNMPLYRYLGGINGSTMPTPMMNILNGGKHANNNLSIQEFMIIPTGEKNFKDSVKMCSEVYHTLKQILKNRNLLTGVGDEGGFAPNLENDIQAIELLEEAINTAGYKLGEEINLGLDIASTEMYFEAEKIGKKDNYYFWKTSEIKTKNEMIDYLEKLIKNYHIVSIEDGLAEEDWEGWHILSEKLQNKIQLVGDDLFVTNPERLKKGIKNKVANAILIKPNQIGTLSETLNTIQIAKKSGYKTIISHRSGETEDTFIADLAVGVNSGQIKTGAPCRTDRVAKYNRLISIESEL